MEKVYLNIPGLETSGAKTWDELRELWLTGIDIVDAVNAGQMVFNDASLSTVCMSPYCKAPAERITAYSNVMWFVCSSHSDCPIKDRTVGVRRNRKRVTDRLVPLIESWKARGLVKLVEGFTQDLIYKYAGLKSEHALLRFHLHQMTYAVQPIVGWVAPRWAVRIAETMSKAERKARNKRQAWLSDPQRSSTFRTRVQLLALLKDRPDLRDRVSTQFEVVERMHKNNVHPNTWITLLSSLARELL